MTESDEEFDLVKKALYVPEIFYDVEPTQTPTTASEYIQIQRIQMKNEERTYGLASKTKSSLSKNNVKSDEGDFSFEWQKKQAKEFSETRIKFLAQLKLKHKKKNESLLNIKNEKKCCTFCLGSEIRKIIFNSETETNAQGKDNDLHNKSSDSQEKDSDTQEKDNDTLEKNSDTQEITSDSQEMNSDTEETYVDAQVEDGHKPLLSILLKFSPNDVEVLLEYSIKWLKVIGPSPDICQWIYALMTCVSKPLSLRSTTALKELKTYCLKQLKDVDAFKYENVVSLNLFCALIKYYFVIKARENYSFTSLYD